MNLDTDESLIKVVLDTNILVSAIAFGGKPEQILSLVLEEDLLAVTSPILLAELREVLSKKFPLKEKDFRLTVKSIEEIFRVIQPKKSVEVLTDDDDNRVLEVAVEGGCKYIVTGDQDLLRLNSFKSIKIVTADEFLEIFNKN